MSVAEVLGPGFIGFDSNGMHMTPEEFDAIEDWDEDYDYELVNGVLIVLPPPGAGERSPSDELARMFLNYQDDLPGIIDDTLPEQTLRTTPNRRRADRVVWIGLGRAPVPGSDVPAIAIEFVSRSRRDRKRDHIVKRQEYAAIGVDEYWVIDRFGRKMTVYFRTGEVLELTEADVYRTRLLPGFELPLARLFAKSDRYRDS
jgi:Uma2 family endonuclease